MPSRILFILTIVFSLGVVALLPVAAQGDAVLECDVQGLLEHQQEHATRLDDLAARLEVDRDNALEDLYITGIAYQSLAIQCGFLGLDKATTAHEGEHQDIEAVTHDEDGHNDAGHETALDRALAVGDPVRGEQLFITLQPAVGFACASCHRVDTTERLIGPGLLGVGSSTHDPSEHMMSNDNSMADMNMGGDDHDAETDNTDEMMMQMETNPVEYIRTSIVDPNAYVVPGFPDNLMPKNFSDIFTDEEINDLIAYLLTLE